MIIGNQPALDVDAIIRQQQVQTGFVYSTHVLRVQYSIQQGGVRGPGENGRSPGTENRKSSPVESEGSAASQQVQTGFVYSTCVLRVKYSVQCPVLRVKYFSTQHCWPIIGQYLSSDLNTDLLLVNTDHMT